ncbi:hypothetical protein SprV_0902727200 [Sparganum proliferum]
MLLSGLASCKKSQILKRWTEQFRSALNRPSTISNATTDWLPQKGANTHLDLPPSLPEIIRAVQQLSGRKSPGSDAIPSETYNHGGRSLTDQLTALFQEMQHCGQVPQDFKDATVIHLYKRKRNRQLCDNNRTSHYSTFPGRHSSHPLNRLNSYLEQGLLTESRSATSSIPPLPTRIPRTNRSRCTPPDSKYHQPTSAPATNLEPTAVLVTVDHFVAVPSPPSVLPQPLHRPQRPASGPLKRDTVCPTLNSVGLRINLHNGIGYRPVPLSNSELVNLLQKIVQSTDAKAKLPHQAKLDELVTLVQFANDEGDFGEGLELGLDLLAFHPKGENLQSASCFNNTISLLLSTGYQLAGRPQFAEVINQHMKNRRIQPTSLKTNS